MQHVSSPFTRVATFTSVVVCGCVVALCFFLCCFSVLQLEVAFVCEPSQPHIIFSCVFLHFLPAGGYKGYGLGMMVEVFCGILAGAQYSNKIRTWKVTDRMANLVRVAASRFLQQDVWPTVVWGRVETLVLNKTVPFFILDPQN